jgi:hypothetical protein
MQAIGTLEIPVLIYGFGTTNGHQAEIQKLERKTRKMLTIHGQHYRRADINRLYVPRKGGRKMTDADRRSLHSRSDEIDGIFIK